MPQIDINEIDAKIQIMKITAAELARAGEDFPAIARNIVRISAGIKMLEINISDVVELEKSDQKNKLHTIRVLDLKMLIQLKRTSADPKDMQRLPVLEETLRQLNEEFDNEQCNYNENENLWFWRSKPKYLPG